MDIACTLYGANLYIYGFLCSDLTTASAAHATPQRNDGLLEWWGYFIIFKLPTHCRQRQAPLNGVVTVRLQENRKSVITCSIATTAESRYSTQDEAKHTLLQFSNNMQAVDSILARQRNVLPGREYV